MKFTLPRILLWISLVFSFAPCLAASFAVVAPKGVQTLTLAEALAAYHESGETEAFQCVHVPVGKNNKPLKGAKPVAVELDEKIYLRIDGKLLGLDRVSSNEKLSSYSDRTAQVDILTLKVTNESEYGESADRLMRLEIFSGGKRYSIKTFGAACGI